jgi:CheY-like chemotaxis protein
MMHLRERGENQDSQKSYVIPLDHSGQSYTADESLRGEVHLDHRHTGEYARPVSMPIPNGGIAISENGDAKRNLRILIADDIPTILRLVKQILNAHAGFEVVGEARDGDQAVSLAETLRPDVVVLNVTMPMMSGFEAARRIRVRVPDSAIVILSSHKDKQFISEARRAGANGYVEKSQADEQLVHAIESAVKGEEFFVVE